jgi:poly(3-hydroxybutyrate) depolymerase
MRRWALAAVAWLLAGCGGSSPEAAGAPHGTQDGGDAFVDVAAPDVGGDSVQDAGANGDGGSRCHVSGTSIACDHQVAMLSDGSAAREITYETPLGTPPSAGWPAVVYFQGSFVPGHSAFAAAQSDPFGMYELTLTVAALLDRGYAVIAPDTASGGTTFWDTNVPPFAQSWAGCPDDVLVRALLAWIAAGTPGPIDTGRLYAMGISSGGFMTSRMAVSYAGRFRALADHSGSYATCSATCSVPTPLPSDHPPTLFLHGDGDTVVPMSAVQPYLSALQGEGHETKLVTEADAGHQWLASAVQAIPDWFDAHP